MLPQLEVVTVTGVGTVAMCRQAALAPTLIHLATDAQSSLGVGFKVLPENLYDRGWTVVSFDLPGHGQEVQQGEVDDGLTIWAKRIRAGEDVVTSFSVRMKYLISYLIAQGYSASQRIAVSGISRGGFMALHALARTPAIKAGIGLIPVTDLAALTEFCGLEERTLVKASVLQESGVEGKRAFVVSSMNDTRVGTGVCVDNMAGIITRAGEPNKLELHVVGENGHNVPTGWDVKAADWVFALVT